MPLKVSERQPRHAPERLADGTLVFRDRADFRPNLTPSEVLQSGCVHSTANLRCQLGSFGGGYFRTIKSSVTRQLHTRAWEEFPKEWYEGLDIATQVASDHYRPAANRYGVRSGRTLGSKDAFGLDAWEQAGWIIEQDPYGWFQWYCRFFLGRRSMDDDRQVGRWGAMCGEKGRWKRNLVARCLREGKAHDDVSCAPVVRQTLQHWAYRLTEADFASYRAKIAAGAKAPFMPSELMPSVSLDSQGAVETQGQSSSPAGVNGEENGRKKKVLASKAAPAAIGADAASGSDRAKRAWAPELCAEPCDASGSASVGDEKKRKRGRKRN